MYYQHLCRRGLSVCIQKFKRSVQCVCKCSLVAKFWKGPEVVPGPTKYLPNWEHVNLAPVFFASNVIFLASSNDEPFQHSGSTSENLHITMVPPSHANFSSSRNEPHDKLRNELNNEARKSDFSTNSEPAVK